MCTLDVTFWCCCCYCSNKKERLKQFSVLILHSLNNDAYMCMGGNGILWMWCYSFSVFFLVVLLDRLLVRSCSSDWVFHAVCMCFLFSSSCFFQLLYDYAYVHLYSSIDFKSHAFHFHANWKYSREYFAAYFVYGYGIIMLLNEAVAWLTSLFIFQLFVPLFAHLRMKCQQ